MIGSSHGLRVSGVAKSFGSQPVLTGLDLTVPSGTFTAILGQSGCGKTTLLRILAGFETPDHGTVQIGDVIANDGHHHLPPEKRRTGYVSQEGTLFPHLDVAANVAFGLARSRDRTARVRELLDLVGLSGMDRRFPHQLSGGQQQRVALARALAVDPLMVLLDEPFASLDANLRLAVRSDIQRILKDSGATVLMVTQDQDEALSMGDLVAVMQGCRMAQVAPPRDLYNRPASAAVAKFVGEANLVEGKAAGENVETWLGPLMTYTDCAHTGPVTVLIRPEQIDVQPLDRPGNGIPGQVVQSSFFGHDTMFHIVPVSDDAAMPPVHARVLGDVRLVPGTRIRITVRGVVVCWPATIDSVKMPSPPFVVKP
jgi:iron(III) transport system ATP-binding protein